MRIRMRRGARRDGDGAREVAAVGGTRVHRVLVVVVRGWRWLNSQPAQPYIHPPTTPSCNFAGISQARQGRHSHLPPQRESKIARKAHDGGGMIRGQAHPPFPPPGRNLPRPRGFALERSERTSRLASAVRQARTPVERLAGSGLHHLRGESGAR